LPGGDQSDEFVFGTGNPVSAVSHFVVSMLCLRAG
jgi:hypothetical protein